MVHTEKTGKNKISKQNENEDLKKIYILQIFLFISDNFRVLTKPYRVPCWRDSECADCIQSAEELDL